MLGQSDMSGRGAQSEIPVFARAGRVKMFSNAWQWVDAYEPTDDATGQVDTISNDSVFPGDTYGASPGMSFATTLAGLRPNTDIGLVPCAVGASSLAVDWAPSLSESTLCGLAIAKMKMAATRGPIKGIIFDQGVSDAMNLAHANAWGTNAVALWSYIATALGVPDLKIVFAICRNDPGLPEFPYWSQMLAAQRSVSGPNIASFETNDLPYRTDTAEQAVHKTTAAQLVSGQRFATAMNTLLEP